MVVALRGETVYSNARLHRTSRVRAEVSSKKANGPQARPHLSLGVAVRVDPDRRPTRRDRAEDVLLGVVEEHDFGGRVPGRLFERTERGLVGLADERDVGRDLDRQTGDGGEPV